MRYLDFGLSVTNYSNATDAYLIGADIKNKPIWAIAKGMGSAGAIAAQYMINKAGAASVSTFDWACRKDLETSVQYIVQDGRQAIQRYVDHDSQALGTESTLVLAAWAPNFNRVLVAHTGNERAYLWRNGTLSRLTDDSQEEISSLLPNVCGFRPKVEDVLLLSSSGLHSSLTDRQIAEILQNNGVSDRSCHELVNRAVRLGATSSVTAVMVRWID